MPNVDQALRVMRVLWAALCSSILLFGVILVVLRGQRAGQAAPEPVVEYALLAFSLVVAVLSFVIPGFIRRQAQTARGRVAPRPLAAVQTTFVLSMALSEAVALFGFVLGILGAPWEVTCTPLAVGFGLAIVRFPTANLFQT